MKANRSRAASSTAGLAAFGGLLLLLLPAATTLAAATTTVRIGSGEAAPDSSVTVRLEAIGVPEPGLGAFTIDVRYGTGVLAAEGCSEDPQDALDTVLCNTGYANGVVRVGGFQLRGGTTGDLALADLTFRVVGSAGQCSELSLDVVELTDADAGALPATTVNGTICAAGGAVGGLTSLALDPTDSRPGEATAATPAAGTLDSEPSLRAEAAARGALRTPELASQSNAVPGSGGGLGSGWWALTGAGAVAVVAGGIFLVRARLRQNRTPSVSPNMGSSG